MRARRSLLALVLQLGALCALSDPASLAAAEKPRARELGLSALIGGTAGALDAITDVAGVEVGHTTLVSGEGRLVAGKGPVRTGVTAILPRGRHECAMPCSARGSRSTATAR